VSGKSFCVEAVKEPAPTTQKPSTTPVPSSSKAITPTSKPTSSPSSVQSTPSTLVTASSTSTSGNGVATPTPIRSGMVNNCKTFYFVEDGDNCGTMAEKYGISTAEVIAWNGLNSGCTNLWQETYACVGIIGGSTKPSTTSSAQTGNGVPTPAPVQPRIVKNCNKFYFVESGDTCAVINGKTGARVADIISWNGLNSGWTDIWGSTYCCTLTGLSLHSLILHIYIATFFHSYSINSVLHFLPYHTRETYACVGVIGQSQTTPTPSPTRPPNSPATPSSIQSGMVQGCTLWHFIGGTTTCQQVLDYQKITLAQFYKWNPAVKADCSGLWKDTHACVRGP
jgi:LysM repeat protein